MVSWECFLIYILKLLKGDSRNISSKERFLNTWNIPEVKDWGSGSKCDIFGHWKDRTNKWPRSPCHCQPRWEDVSEDGGHRHMQVPLRNPFLETSASPTSLRLLTASLAQSPYKFCLWLPVSPAPSRFPVSPDFHSHRHPIFIRSCDLSACRP